MPCPKGIPDSNCPGKGIPENCHLYDKKSKLCYYSVGVPL